MSAEVENNKEDEKQELKRTSYHKILDQWQFAFKLLELVLSAICVGFIYEPAHTTGMGKSHLHHVGVMYTAYTGSMVIIICFIIGRLLKDQLGYKTSFVFSTASSALFLTTGILLTADKAILTKDHFFHPSRYLLNMMTISIVLTFVNSIIFAIDAVITFKKQQDF